MQNIEITIMKITSMTCCDHDYIAIIIISVNMIIN